MAVQLYLQMIIFYVFFAALICNGLRSSKLIIISICWQFFITPDLCQPAKFFCNTKRITTTENLLWSFYIGMATKA